MDGWRDRVWSDGGVRYKEQYIVVVKTHLETETHLVEGEGGVAECHGMELVLYRGEWSTILLLLGLGGTASPILITAVIGREQELV